MADQIRLVFSQSVCRVDRKICLRSREKNSTTKIIGVSKLMRVEVELMRIG